MEWLWSGLGWALLAVGLGLLAWALFWDRAGWRGRAVLRCRGCWYDLTGCAELSRVSKSSQVVCPECGRGHRSIRAMQRTRRRKRWAVVALGLLLGAYGASVWPRVKSNNFAAGWVAAIPTPVLMMSMRWMPAEAGSLPDRNSVQAAIPYAQWPLSERFGNQIKARMYKPESTTRLDRWLFFRAARGETPDVLTDPTAVRGDVYRYVVNAWLRQGRMSGEQERWARSVNQVRAEHAEYALDGLPTYARVQIRRLVEGGPWRVRLGEHNFETKLRAWPAGRDLFFDLRPLGLPVNGWWDGNVMIDRHMFRGNGLRAGPSPTTFARTISGRIFEGDAYADVWWPVADVLHGVEFKIARRAPAGPGGLPGGAGPRVESITGFDVMDDDQAGPVLDWLSRSINSRFLIDGDMWRGHGMQVPNEFVVFIGDGGRAPATLPVFTFGGNASVMLEVRRGGGDPDNPRIDTVRAFECDPAWWALRDDVDSQGKRILDHGWLRVGMKPTIPFRRYGGEIPVGSESLAQNDEVIGAWLEIRFGTDLGGNEGFRGLSDLQAARFLTHPVRIRIGHGPFQNAPVLRSEGVRLPFDRTKWPVSGTEQN